MIDPNRVHDKIIDILDKNKANYKYFSHKIALTYEDLEIVRKETGFYGTEGKCMVIKVLDKFIVYVTIQGKKLNFDNIKDFLNAKDIRLALPGELKDYFGAEPGCAYPFGFESNINIYVDPVIYNQEWFLFSPALPDKTIQIKGCDLKKVFNNIDNKVIEIENFNQ